MGPSRWTGVGASCGAVVGAAAAALGAALVRSARAAGAPFARTMGVAAAAGGPAATWPCASTTRTPHRLLLPRLFPLSCPQLLLLKAVQLGAVLVAVLLVLLLLVVVVPRVVQQEDSECCRWRWRSRPRGLPPLTPLALAAAALSQPANVAASAASAVGLLSLNFLALGAIKDVSRVDQSPCLAWAVSAREWARVRARGGAGGVVLLVALIALKTKTISSGGTDAAATGGGIGGGSARRARCQLLWNSEASIAPDLHAHPRYSTTLLLVCSNFKI